jgi:hypothetical protein
MASVKVAAMVPPTAAPHFAMKRSVPQSPLPPGVITQ